MSRFLLIILFFFIPAITYADNFKSLTREQEIKVFQFYNQCKPVGMVVENIPKDGKKMGVTEERITTLVETKLRTARIFNEKFSAKAGDTYLYININVVGVSSSVTVEFKKVLGVFFPYIKNKTVFSYAAVWDRSSTGTHATRGKSRESVDYLLSLVSESVDVFIVEYLRIYQKYCSN